MGMINYVVQKNYTETASSAPYTIKVVPNGVANANDIVAKVAKRITASDETIRAVMNASIEEAIENGKDGNATEVGCVKFAPKIRGGVGFVDTPFDATAQKYLLLAYDGSEMADTFADATPVRLSADDLAASIKVSNVMDVETNVFGVIRGTNDALLTGNGLTMDAEGEYIKLLNKKTLAVVATAVIGTCSKGQRVTFHFATSPQSGEYYLEIATKGLIGLEQPNIYRKVVTVVHIDYPPTITKAYPSGYETQLDKVVNNGDNVIEGTNLLGAKIYKNSVSEENELATTAASTATKLVYEGCGLTAGTAFKILVANADGTAERNVTAINPLDPTIDHVAPESEPENHGWMMRTGNILVGTNLAQATKLVFHYVVGESVFNEEMTISRKTDTEIAFDCLESTTEEVTGDMIITYPNGTVTKENCATLLRS